MVGHDSCALWQQPSINCQFDPHRALASLPQADALNLLIYIPIAAKRGEETVHKQKRRPTIPTALHIAQCVGAKYRLCTHPFAAAQAVCWPSSPHSPWCCGTETMSAFLIGAKRCHGHKLTHSIARNLSLAATMLTLLACSACKALTACHDGANHHNYIHLLVASEFTTPLCCTCISAMRLHGIVSCRHILLLVWGVYKLGSAPAHHTQVHITQAAQILSLL
jgi:hypothetical protein